MTATAQGRPRIADVLTLSPLQEGLYSLAKLAEDGLDLYSMQFVMGINESVDTELLQQSLQALLHRHPNVMASFWDRGISRVVQVIPTGATIPWEHVAVPDDGFDEAARRERHRAFALDRGPLLRVVIAEADNGARRLILTAHHILMDGWSLVTFFREMIAVYDAGGNTDALPPVRPYRDYIRWLTDLDTEAVLQRWTRYLHGAEPVLLAPGARVGDTVPQMTRLTLPVAETTALTDWCREHGLTLNTAVQFAWAVTLGRLTGRDDVTFGGIVSGRPDQLSGVESMVGLFINAVPVRVRVDAAEPVAQACRRLQQEMAEMRDDGVVGLTRIQRAGGHASLFDTMLVFENAPGADMTDPIPTRDGGQFVPVTVESLAHYPLTLVSLTFEGRLVLSVEAVQEALGPIDGADCGRRVLAVLQQMAADQAPTAGHLDVLLPGEVTGRPSGDGFQPISDGDDSDGELRTGSIVAELIRQVRQTPEAIALSDSRRTWSYGELADRVTRLAAYLAAQGAGPETPVLLCLDRSLEMVEALLATMAAGSAYVPVDPGTPAARLASMVEQAAPAIVLGEGPARPEWEGRAVHIDLRSPAVLAQIRSTPALAVRPVHPDTAAYIIFTSGTTGAPKGVVGTHRALAAYFDDHRENVYRAAQERLGRTLRIAHAWPFTFDASWQPLLGLLDGQRVHVLGADEMHDAGAVVAAIRGEKLDMIDTTPSMLGRLIEAGLTGGPWQLAVLALGGEAITPVLWKALRALGESTQVLNCYGPTEATVEAVVARVDQHPSPTIGFPTSRGGAYVLDDRLHPVPVGVVGELYLAGGQLTRGYLGDGAQTSSRFVADPAVAGGRMYATGDLARRDAAGSIVFLGRRDEQVKIRGFRVELGEIDAALADIPEVATAAVIPVERAGGTRLAAFVVARTDPHNPDALTPGGLRRELVQRLPDYMVPTRIVVVPALPTRSTGKLDTGALEALLDDWQPQHGSPPETETERLLAGLLDEVLERPIAGIDEDLLDSGIDSIGVIALVNRVRDEGRTVTPRMVLENGTVRRLAEAIDHAVEADGDDGTQPAVLVPVMRWMRESPVYRRFAQTMPIQVPAGVDEARLTAVLQAVLDGHPMLRAVLDRSDNREPELVPRDPGTVPASGLLRTASQGLNGAAIEAECAALLDQLDPDAGEMVRALWIRDPDDAREPSVLVLAIHHLVVDAVSWTILLGDLEAADRRYRSGEQSAVGPEGTGFATWSGLLDDWAGQEAVRAQADYWSAQLAGPDPLIGSRLPQIGVDTWRDHRLLESRVSAAVTGRLLAVAGPGRDLRDLLLTALHLTVSQWRADRTQAADTGTLVALEGHGRADELFGEYVDTSRTVGWFTAVYPVRLAADSRTTLAVIETDPGAAAALVEAVAADVAAVPTAGLGFGLLRYPPGEETGTLSGADAQAGPQIEFSFLGRQDLARPTGESGWGFCMDPDLHRAMPLASEPELALRYTLDIASVVLPADGGARLETTFRWSPRLMAEGQVAQIATLWERSIAVLAAAVMKTDETKTDERCSG